MRHEHRLEAEAFATSALNRVVALLPSWGLQNEELADAEIVLNDSPYIVTISPWRGTGRDFWVKPKGRRRTPFVRGFVDVNASGLWVQPQHFIPNRGRG